MASNKNFLYYLSAIAIFLLLKTVYPYAENDDLFFILSPVNRLLEFLTNSESQYYSDSGYYYQTLNILIEKSCSGFNFLMLCFLMLAFQLAGYFNKNNFKYLLLPFALFLSYILTIFTNTSRIILSILGQNTADKFLPSIFILQNNL